jgi:hypothetical protein
VEVAEKRAFFGLKWLKNVRFSDGSGCKTCIFQVEVAEKCVFWAEVAEKRAFFRWKWLKNVRFSGGSG